MCIVGRVSSWFCRLTIVNGVVVANGEEIRCRWMGSPLYDYLHDDSRDYESFARAIREEIYLQTGLDFSEARILKLDLCRLKNSPAYRKLLTQG